MPHKEHLSKNMLMAFQACLPLMDFEHCAIFFNLIHTQRYDIYHKVSIKKLQIPSLRFFLQTMETGADMPR